MPEKAKAAVSTLDLVLFTLLSCDGDQKFVPTDEVAIQAFRLFPLKFCWDTLSHLPNWDRVRQWLSEAKKEKHGALVEGFSGDRKEGWRLTAAGTRRLRFKRASFDGVATAAADERKYLTISTEDLVAYAIDDLRRARRPVTIPSLTEICARRFPMLFELTGYPGWPDSATVADAAKAAEASGTTARVRGSLNLTDRGQAKANEVRRVVDSESVRIRLEDIGRGLTHRAAKDVEDILGSRAWALFRDRKPISDGLACEAVQCSLQSHPKAMRRALEHYRNAALELNRADVAEFIDACADALRSAIG